MKHPERASRKKRVTISRKRWMRLLVARARLAFFFLACLHLLELFSNPPRRVRARAYRHSLVREERARTIELRGWISLDGWWRRRNWIRRKLFIILSHSFFFYRIQHVGANDRAKFREICLEVRNNWKYRLLMVPNGFVH